jgi:hypothetical protein
MRQRRGVVPNKGSARTQVVDFGEGGWLYAVIEEGAAEGNPGFLTYWHQAHRRVVATRQWYTAERQRLVAALSTAGGTQ